MCVPTAAAAAAAAVLYVSCVICDSFYAGSTHEAVKHLVYGATEMFAGAQLLDSRHHTPRRACLLNVMMVVLLLPSCSRVHKR
jgi:hypothetical protein